MNVSGADHVIVALDRHEAAQRDIAKAPLKLPSAAHLDRCAKAEEKGRERTDAVDAELHRIRDRIGDLLRAERARRSSPWRRWFPDAAAEAELASLRGRRELLAARHTVAQNKYLRAIADRGAARKAFDAEVRRRTSERAAAAAVAAKRLAIVARAKALLAAVPALAYVGARKLIEMARRVEKAKEQGYDPGPGFSPP